MIMADDQTKEISTEHKNIVSRMVETLVIGLDAACWNRMNPLIEAGHLPNIEAVCETGISGTLSSTSPPMTPPAWTSMATGVGPERHGVHDFFEFDPESYKVIPMGDVDLPVPTVWDVFASRDRRIGVLNFPIVYPPPRVPGFFVSGIPFDVGDGIAHPKDLQRKLADKDYQVQPHRRPDNPAAYLSELKKLATARFELTEQLLAEKEVELLWVVFMALDWAQHYLWNKEVDGESAVGSLYEHIDDLIGGLRRAVGDDCNVVIVSDHGATEVDNEVHLNSLLAKWGYLSKPDQGTLDKMMGAVFGQMFKLGTNLPEPVKATIRRTFLRNQIVRLQKAAGETQLAMNKEIEWNRTSAFSYGYMGRVHIHREDWYQEGTVRPGEYETVLAELVKGFENLRAFDGEKRLFESVRTGQEVYCEIGPDIPDILLVPEDWRTTMYGDFGDDWIQKPDRRQADHAPEGVFAATGPDIAEGAVDIDAVDVAPTLLQLHQLPIPEKMDGVVHWEVFDPEFSSEASARYEPWSNDTTKMDVEGTADKADVESRLEDLGYL